MEFRVQEFLGFRVSKGWAHVCGYSSHLDEFTIRRPSPIPADSV